MTKLVDSNVGIAIALLVISLMVASVSQLAPIIVLCCAVACVSGVFGTSIIDDKLITGARPLREGTLTCSMLIGTILALVCLLSFFAAGSLLGLVGFFSAVGFVLKMLLRAGSTDSDHR